MSRLWLVAYDIADDKRRRRVAERLADHGQRVQESVFEGWLELRELSALLKELAELIEPAEDSMRLYPLGKGLDERRHTAGNMKTAAPTPRYWLL